MKAQLHQYKYKDRGGDYGGDSEYFLTLASGDQVV